MCDNTSNWKQKHISKSSCFLLYKAFQKCKSMPASVNRRCVLKFPWSCGFVYFSFQCWKIPPFSFRFALYILIYNCFIFLVKWTIYPYEISFFTFFFLQIFALKGTSGISIVITIYFLLVFSGYLFFF